MPQPDPRRPGRRRFLTLMGAGLAGAMATVAGCGGNGAGERGSGPSTGPGTPLSTTRAAPTGTAPTETPGPTTEGGAVYVALRSTARRRTDVSSGAAARAAMGGFGLAMLRAVAGAHPNTVLSPYSLYTVLAMARAGAAGRTAGQLDHLLAAPGASAQGGIVTAVDHAVAAALAAGGTAITVRSANQVWIQRDLRVRQEYLDALARQYGVQAVAAAFRTAPDRVRAAINAWVADRTAGLIPDLFGPGTIDVDTRLALVNALYLKAAWDTPFAKPTGSRAFTTATGAVVRTPMMQAPRAVPGVNGDGWTAVRIPYAGGGLAMTLLVPDAGRYAAVLAAADAGLIGAASAAGGGRTANLQLTMPPFRTRSAPDVRHAAESLGVTDLFDPRLADLSQITGARDLYAASFVHQAVISVDQNGTEAAAATGMGVGVTAAPEVGGALVVDRPYLYWIADTVTGAPLFLGTVTDPTA